MTEVPLPAPWPADAVATPQGTPQEGLSVLEPDLSEWRQDLTGLLVLGALTGSFSWCGHKIVLKTLTTDEELLAAMLVKEFEQTIGGPKALATSMAALSVQFVDDRPLPTPLGETGGTYQWAMERYLYARRWYPPTIDAMYEHYLQLETRQRKVLEELGKASGPGEPATPGSSASSGPLTAGDSSAGPPSP